jgi:N-acetylglucosaminyl-diphospho-decaprenol L-rhamnosyltransferase
MSRVSVVIVSYNVWSELERCLSKVDANRYDVIVVDSASSDGSPARVRERFPDVRLIALPRNPGYGAALNAGIELANGAHVLVMNADAWPIGDAIERLVEFADANSRVGIVGPLLRNPDGTVQPSVRGFPTLWRLATEYFFLRWLAPRSVSFNAFYGAGFDYRSVCAAEFLMGAVLLLRRDAIAEVGGFDPNFFMFSEEVDLCYRMHSAGWDVRFFPGAEFVHVGGASTRLTWEPMYREQIRGHLRFFAKHYGRNRAELARKLLVSAFIVRSLVFRGERGRLTRETASWLTSGDAIALIEG